MAALPLLNSLHELNAHLVQHQGRKTEALRALDAGLVAVNGRLDVTQRLLPFAEQIAKAVRDVKIAKAFNQITGSAAHCNHILGQAKLSIGGSKCYRRTLVELEGAVDHEATGILVQNIAQGAMNASVGRAMATSAIIQGLHSLNTRLQVIEGGQKIRALKACQDNLAVLEQGITQRQILDITLAIKVLLNDFGFGTLKPDRSLVFESQSLIYQQKGDVILIVAKDGRGKVLEVQKQRIKINRLSDKDFRVCMRFKERVVQRQALSLNRRPNKTVNSHRKP